MISYGWRRGVAIPRIFGMVSRGWSSSAIWGQLGRSDTRYLKGIFNRDVGKARTKVQMQKTISEEGRKVLFSKDKIPEFKFLNDKKYYYTYGVESFDPVTKESQKNYVSFYTNRRLGVEEREDKARAIFNTEEYEVSARGLEYEFEGEFHNEGWRW